MQAFRYGAVPRTNGVDFEWRQTGYMIMTSLIGLGLFCLLRDNILAAGGFFVAGGAIVTVLILAGRPDATPRRDRGAAKH